MLVRRPTPASVVLPALLLFLGCSPGSAPETEETLMRSGLDSLYTRHDPTAAANQFRKVLQMNSSHYGATYQLATALDAAGKTDEARAMWEKMLPMAEAAQDKSTAEHARARLAEAEAAKEMQAGLDALYTRHEPDAAAAQFRKVLELNPTHYGATYQLAAALDAAGKKEEARPLWETVLQMADKYNDQSTARTARARLTPGQP
jgi:tetratricopeptide (TPR) repeat protein